MSEPTTVIKFFEDTYGAVELFGALPAGTEFPAVFGQLNITPDLLDRAFFDAYGERPPGMALTRHRQDTLENLAQYLFYRFVPRWTRYCKDMLAEYEPAENYMRDETETISRDGRGKDKTTRTYPSYKETTKQGHAITTDSTGNLYGFDSTGPVPSDTGQTKTVYDQSGNNGQTLPGDTLEITGSQVTEFEHGTGDFETRSLTAFGNIGTMTAAQMLREDIQFYIDNGDIIDYMIKEIADLITIPIYN
jgi:hypothetical protein